MIEFSSGLSVGKKNKGNRKAQRAGYAAAVQAMESRRLLAYSATLSGPIARFTGDSASGSGGDVLAFDTSGGNLMHNRASDPGFNSAFDFDSTTPGDQTLAADATSRVYITPGGGPDTLIFGNAIAAFQQPASTLLAQFEINHDASPSDGVKVVVDDTTSAVANTFEVAPGRIVATGINVRYGGTAAYSEIDVIGGSAADTFNVTPSPDVPYVIDGGDPAAAPGDVLNYDADFADATDNGTQITRAGRQPVNYQNIETVNLFNETADASQLVVTNTNSFGPNSLRNAINLANFLPGPNTITFDIPGGGVHTITPKDELPAITDPVVIDGYTQTGATPNTLVNGNNAVLKVVLSGHGSDLTYGLDIAAGNSTVRGLVINEIKHPISSGLDGKGILLRTNGGNTIEGNFIGTDVTGTVALGNGGTGVIVAADSNIIGGTTAGARNIITDNNLGGVVISSATGNRVEGNFIGTDATGTAALGNGNSGVEVEGASNNTIGGTTAGARNIISGNQTSGVIIRFSTSTGNRVEGNFIGTDVTGTAALGNSTGVSISQAANNTIGGTTAAHRNVISGNTNFGVAISGSTSSPSLGTVVQGNYVGLDSAGTTAIANGLGGISVSKAVQTLIGGAAPGERNIISGNSEAGILIGEGADHTRILGNYIGTNAAGTAALSNGSSGIKQIGGDITIGGPAAGDRNVISGWLYGIYLDATDTSSTAAVYGNFIGTDVTGTSDLGNDFGILVSHSNGCIIGGAEPGEGNLISGNDVFGISTSRFSSGVGIYGNRIGTDVAGKLPLGNGQDGIQINGNNNYVGGMSAGQGNVIAFNGANGVNIRSAGGSLATPNFIYSNSIFSNALLGIDLNDDGVTANDPGDADIGPNGSTNYPTVTSAFTNATGVAVIGTLEAVPYAGHTVQIFASPGPDPSGFGEGKLLLGTIYVNTDATGFAMFTAEFPFAIPAGQVITATATAQDGTSEFSKATTVTGNPPRLSIGDVTVTEGNGVPVSATFTITLSDAVSGAVKVDFATADGTAVAQADYLSQSGAVTFNPGETTRTVTVTVNPDAVAEGTENFVVNLSNASIADIADGQGVGTILDRTPAPPPDSVYLSSLTPSFATNGWGKFENDKSNGEKGDHDGHTIKLNGTTYARGLGVHANSDLRYVINKNYTRFTADVGVDDEVGSNGNVIFQVFADGVKLFDSGAMTGNSPTQHVDVNLTNRSQLQLVVLTNGSSAYDHADWADAKIFNSTTPPPPTADAFLSDLNPTSATNGWGKFENDKSNGEQGDHDGHTIKLNGTTYARGLGVHANSDLRYNINKQYSRFTADVGIDDEVNNNGSVIFQVWADGILLFDSGVMTGSSTTKHVDVNLTNRNELKLLVLSNGSTAYDHADWADAKVHV